MPGEDKTEQPTPKKLREAREEGNVPLSRDVVTLATLLIGVLMLRMRLTSIEASIRQFLMSIITKIGAEPELMLTKDLMIDFVRTAFVCALPVALVIAAAEIIAGGAQTQFNFSKKALRPKFSRMNPLNGIKRIFSIRGVVELLKSLAKIIVLVVLVFLTLRDDLVQIARMGGVGVVQSAAMLFSMMYGLVMKVCLAFGVIAAADFLFQRRQHKKDLMMTKQEVKDEYKMTEGNPEIKGRIKKRQREISQRRMMQQVPNADVIVRNPTHFAVALKYDPDRAAAPIVLAKGMDSLALRIVEVAEQSQVPCIENRTLARGLYSACEVDQMIPAEYYSAVAELLVFIYKQQNRLDSLS